MIKYILITILLILSSCISGGKLDSKVKYLNGDSYKNKAYILGVPVLETKDQEVKKKKRK